MKYWVPHLNSQNLLLKFSILERNRNNSAGQPIYKKLKIPRDQGKKMLIILFGFTYVNWKVFQLASHSSISSSTITFAQCDSSA